MKGILLISASLLIAAPAAYAASFSESQADAITADLNRKSLMERGSYTGEPMSATTVSTTGETVVYRTTSTSTPTSTESMPNETDASMNHINIEDPKNPIYDAPSN